MKMAGTEMKKTKGFLNEEVVKRDQSFAKQLRFLEKARESRDRGNELIGV